MNRFSRTAYTAALYCRLSVEDKQKQGESESIQNQKALLLDYAKQQNWDIYAIYCDEDYSGLDDERPDFLRLLADAKNRKFHVILCKSQSRFTRNMETAEKYLHHHFLLWGIRFVSIVDHVDSDYSGGKHARQINSLVNEWYCEEISQNIRCVFRRKMEQGLFIGPYPCYGYLKNPADRHRLIVDETVRPIIRSIFAFCLEGKNCRQIAQILTDQKIPTPIQHKKNRGEDKNHFSPKGYSEALGLWHPNTVRKILKNKTYTGCIVQGRERKLTYKSKKTVLLPQQDWIVVEDMHEALISKELFQAVQNRL